AWRGVAEPVEIHLWPKEIGADYLIARTGRYAEARNLFGRLLSRCNDVGLLAEEIDPLTGRMLGNFPQAYSHVGLINCALNLSRKKGPAEERAAPQESPIPLRRPLNRIAKRPMTRGVLSDHDGGKVRRRTGDERRDRCVQRH